MFADISFGCEQRFYYQQIDKNLMVNDATTFYQLSFFHEFDSWKKVSRVVVSVCFGLFWWKKMISNQWFIEHDISQKIPNSTQIAGNSIKSISNNNSKGIKMDNFNHFKKLTHFAEHLKQADGLLITAGAGMGVDSGLPWLSEEWPKSFWKAYPAKAPWQKLCRYGDNRTVPLNPKLAFGVLWFEAQCVSSSQTASRFSST